GIHAARLAGIPPDVIGRAKEILFELECARSVGGDMPAVPRAESTELARANPESAPGMQQMDLFGMAAEHPIVAALGKLDISRITPLQAMQILDELIRAARK
ncbi:DNA mismatch repair protein MutS, partial [Candidatus Sumerlaeota bacterium]|nr:DNA mismatch repair protein MutS [Candidatus Sumerlaeota bacterium]